MNEKSFNYDFSVIMPIYNVELYLTDAIESVINQTIGFENIQLILVNDDSPDKSEVICKEYAQKYPKNIVYVKKQNGGVSSARNYGLKYAEGRYIQFLDPDDLVSEETFENVLTFFNQYKNQIDIVAIPIFFEEGRTGEHNLNNKFSSTRILDVEKEPHHIITHCCSTFIQKDALKNIRFDENCKIGEDAKLVNLIISHKKKYGLVKEAKYHYRVREDGSSAMQTAKANKNWFNHSLITFSKNLIDITQNNEQKIPLFLQYMVMHDLKWKLLIKDISETPLDENEYCEFLTLIREVLSYIDDDVIIDTKSFSHFYLYHALKIKHGKNYSRYVYERETEQDYYLYREGKIVQKLSDQTLTIEILEENEDSVHIEGFWSSLFNSKGFNFYAKIGETKIKAKNIKRQHNDYISLGEVIKKYPGFSIDIPKSYLADKQHIEFFITKGKKRKLTKLRFFKYSGLSNDLYNSYAAKKDYIFYYNYKKLMFEKNNVKNRFIKEFRFLKSLHKLGGKSKKRKSAIKKAMVARMAHHVFTIFNRKPVWLFIDRQDKADDNAEHLFKYAINKNDGVKKYFVIKKDSKDYGRIKKYGKVIPYRSFKHKILTLSSSKVISTHADIWVVNPFFNMEIYFRDLFNFEFVFLQHGITMADHSEWLNKYSKNIKLLVTSAKPEYRSIVKGNYNYKKENIFLGGFPRYDNLKKSEGEKQLLIMPTWRKDIVLPKDQAKGVRPYNPKFKESEYFARYNALINDERLIEFAKNNNYKITFFPHPDIQQQIVDFEKHDYVEFADYNSSYQMLFNSSNIMITDFSSVAFDFAYEKKPVIYYQYEKSYHFKLDYYDYKKMGFGDVIEDHNSLVDKVIYYMKNDSRMEDKYRKRVDNFFAYTDKNNRNRIYNAILQLDKSKVAK
ncbi:glycosyl transferase family A [Bacillus halotolerans]|uniref:poly(glucosyl N-acetylgalactosamine 1-phosphate) glucosyltransferase n=1 Tax=Bacillus halotolerans TaxID=260554 RepID=UPI000CD84A1C|nr:poly(glucosyl N-acetylgalactosamine 1-phosphate) glucosyltransferase [Bacillus halotolerans]PON03053.1 glycosyl transferase family A [Bacillus halotolerans]